MGTMEKFTDTDWDCWAGATEWDNGHAPLFGYVGDAAVLADATGIELHDSELQYALRVRLTPQAANAICVAMLAALERGESPEHVCTVYGLKEA